MLYLDADFVSPDPTLRRSVKPAAEGWWELPVYPHAVAWTNRPGALSEWRKSLDVHKEPAEVRLPSQGDGGGLQLVLDFGTELEGSLVLHLEVEGGGSIAISFGETVWEAREWGPPSTCQEQRPRKQHWKIRGSGTHRREFETGGFRFARLWLLDFEDPVTLKRAQVNAKFVGERQRGAFNCPDERLQRIWSSSIYTARLCTRPDAFWDGIKRDRVGWFGDARITKLAWDAAYFEPEPTLKMLGTLESGVWANEIPNYSFDALAMLRRHILVYGKDQEAIEALWQQALQFLRWVIRTQMTEEGLITRRDDVKLQFQIGFTDWSPQPLGGRLEELAPLQLAWLECLENAAWIAKILNDGKLSEKFQRIASSIARVLHSRFWVAGKGYHHTLNLAVPPETPWKMPLEPGLHYRLSYEEDKSFGPSGPSLHAAAMAVFAGMPAYRPEVRGVLRRVLADEDLPPIITSYYQYYTSHARAACGDVGGALKQLRTYFGDMLMEHDSATIWESYEPDVTGIDAYSLNAWPKSLCHGWGSGSVPFIQRYLAGISVQQPGFDYIRLDPSEDLSVPFTLIVPTPHGIIRAHREEEGGPVTYELPEGVDVSNKDNLPENVILEED